MFGGIALGLSVCGFCGCCALQTAEDNYRHSLRTCDACWIFAAPAEPIESGSSSTNPCCNGYTNR